MTFASNPVRADDLDRFNLSMQTNPSCLEQALLAPSLWDDPSSLDQLLDFNFSHLNDPFVKNHPHQLPDPNQACWPVTLDSSTPSDLHQPLPPPPLILPINLDSRESQLIDHPPSISIPIQALNRPPFGHDGPVSTRPQDHTIENEDPNHLLDLWIDFTGGRATSSSSELQSPEPSIETNNHPLINDRINPWNPPTLLEDDVVQITRSEKIDKNSIPSNLSRNSSVSGISSPSITSSCSASSSSSSSSSSPVTTKYGLSSQTRPSPYSSLSPVSDSSKGSEIVEDKNEVNQNTKKRKSPKTNSNNTNHKKKKRDESLERNRLAASRSRQKKKLNQLHLEQESIRLESIQVQLKKTLNDLLIEKETLKNQILLFCRFNPNLNRPSSSIPSSL